MSDPASGKPATAPGAPASADPLPEPARWIKENFEAIVVAFIMALVIRCFCLEVFKIPTASMEPTLLGDARDRSRGGDRIMVNKFAYEVADVKRYDVLVFKFPLDLSRNFIKRCVGLPDEDLAFVGGDIYTRKGQAPFAVARKPVHVQENVWVPVYAGGCDPGPFRERWKPATPEKDNWELHAGALRTFAGPGKAPETRFAFAPADVVVYDVDRDRPGIRESPHPVPDLRLGARVEFLGTAGELDLTLRQAEGTPRERTFRVLIRPNAPVVVQHPDRNGAPSEVELKVAVKPQVPVDVALLVYDGACVVLLDGGVVHDQAWQTAPPPPGSGPAAARASLGTRNAEVLVRDLAVARDLYYFVIGDGDPFPADRPVHIPPDCHLLVGDNLRNSHDGRAWRRKEVEFVDGSTVYWDVNLLLDEPQGEWIDQIPSKTALFLKKSDTNPHQNEIGWAVPRDRIRDIRQPRTRHRFSLTDGTTVLWDTDLVEPLPNGGFALYALNAETGGRGEKARTLAAGQVADYGPVPPVTWVERRHIVGKAFAIWWPPGRWFRLIR
jgi:signal peptidase I